MNNIYYDEKKNSKQTIGEEIANSISHFLMIPLSVFIFFIYYELIKDKSEPIWPLFCFFINMFNLYLFSFLYHSCVFVKAKMYFQKIDHICIYLLIWGNFMPFLFFVKSLQRPLFLLPFLNFSQIFFLFQTILVFLGIFLKVFFMNKWNRMHLFFYLLLGWSGLIILSYLWELDLRILTLLFFGGILYSIGIIFYNKSYKKYYHFIWHIFVILGNLFHVGSVYYLVKSL
ncbi:PAQR family membrane homeostasis protein TrhA [Texas Phoenix palm phytoplasma]|uniref:PAQR family membrane homeostasis protein TrhA n=1 Tax=Texas Phoenix palm phytoplasma TaxID=176709 RepID=UPI001FEFD195|nr:hemolysin III family protein [Texas Phoenix palm phytoplasma]